MPPKGASAVEILPVFVPAVPTWGCLAALGWVPAGRGVVEGVSCGFRFGALGHRGLGPPSVLGAFRSGGRVLHREEVARRGRGAAFVPWAPVCRFERSPGGTVFCKP